MKIKTMADVLDAKVVCGEAFLEVEVHYGFASDLLSDVLTLDSDHLALITGMASPQTIRTAEMADIVCIVFVRGKKVSPEMIQIARENRMVLLECRYSLYRAVVKLHEAGLQSVY